MHKRSPRPSRLQDREWPLDPAGSMPSSAHTSGRAKVGRAELTKLNHSEFEPLLRSAYQAFNSRDVDAAVELMHPDVDWPTGALHEEPDGSVTVDVQQAVHDARTGALLSASRVRHRYRIEGGLIVRMDVLPA